MQPLDLNLASRPFKNNALLWVGHFASVLLLSAFTIWSVQTYRERTSFVERMQEEAGTTKIEFEKLDRRDREALAAINRYDLEVLGVQADRANQAIQWQAFSWTRLFNRMAEVQPHRIKMLSVRPIFRATREDRAIGDDTIRQPGIPVSVEGTAKDVEAIFELQNALLASPYFGFVDPERLDRTDRKEYLFKLRFHYLPEVEEEPDAEKAVETEVAADGAPSAGGPDPAEVAPTEVDPGETADGEPVEATDSKMELTQVEDAWEDAGEAAAAADGNSEERPAARGGSGPGAGRNREGQRR